MGLDVSHDCWSGAYSFFAEWRSAIFDVAYGGGPRKVYDYLDEVKAWTEDDARRTDPLMVLLMHSDCDGSIAHEHTMPIACRLRDVLDQMPEHWREDTIRFIAGLGRAHATSSAVLFH